MIKIVKNIGSTVKITRLPVRRRLPQSVRFMYFAKNGSVPAYCSRYRIEKSSNIAVSSKDPRPTRPEG